MIKEEKKLAVLTAGGTGGHINSALALGEMFRNQGWDVVFMTGMRPLDYQLFQGEKVYHLPSAPLKGRSPWQTLVSLAKNIKSFFWVLGFFLRNKPHFALGTGGYVCGPTLMAGFVLRRPIYVLEQNSVLGLTNKMLLFFSTKVFVNFHETLGIPSSFKKKIVVSGNPIRSNFSQFRQDQESRKKGGLATDPLRVTIFGGSLGAGPINEMVWKFIGEAPPFPLQIRHQTGKISGGKPEGPLQIHPQIEYESREYFHQIEKEYAWCDLVICRSGASTVSELRIVKKPGLLIPYPFHRDQHQFHNAQRLKEEASFPVYVETCEGLEKEGFKNLREILQKVKDWAMKEEPDQKEQKGQVPEKEPTAVIYQEILKYV